MNEIKQEILEEFRKRYCSSGQLDYYERIDEHINDFLSQSLDRMQNATAEALINDVGINYEFTDGTRNIELNNWHKKLRKQLRSKFINPKNK